MSAFHGGINWSAQHSSFLAKVECGHEAATSHLLFGDPAIRDLAGRRVDVMPLTGVGKIFKPELRVDFVRRVIYQAVVDATGFHDAVVTVTTGDKRGMNINIALPGHSPCSTAEG